VNNETQEFLGDLVINTLFKIGETFDKGIIVETSHYINILYRMFVCSQRNQLQTSGLTNLQSMPSCNVKDIAFVQLKTGVLAQT